ncbi:hypothetical protein CDD83_5700 [Cordyceps sp. RAO-2017]|nr:hypothetical protein CDD83_5700 [Cordyceps sp. RAO-2017]
MRARLETRRAGILVLPLLGYSLRTVVPPALLEERLEADEEGELLRWVRVRVVRDSRLRSRRSCDRTSSRSRTRSGKGGGRTSSGP